MAVEYDEVLLMIGMISSVNIDCSSTIHFDWLFSFEIQGSCINPAWIQVKKWKYNGINTMKKLHKKGFLNNIKKDSIFDNAKKTLVYN